MRFGFGHDRDRQPGNGDLADFCPACPQPGINLPEDWHTHPEQSVFFALANRDTYFVFTGGYIVALWLLMATSRQTI
jgi:hypothetical protein